MSTHDYKGLTIEIQQDAIPYSPREDDNLGTFAFFHRDFRNESDIDSDDFNLLEEMEEHIESRNGLDAIALRVYLYSHSGQTISVFPFNCKWDSGPLGFVFVTREDIRKEFGWKRISAKRLDQIKGYLSGEVKTYDQYIRGEVYGYIIKDDEEELDTCWGFYGEEEHCLENAKMAAEYYIKTEEETSVSQVK